MKLEGYQITMRPVAEGDLDMLRCWRNDPQISQQMISQDEITAEQQLAWFKRIENDASQKHFIIHYKGTPIGSANIKTRGIGHTLETAKAIEPGLYIADEKYRNNILAFAPTLLINDYCFYTLGVSTLKAVVKASNHAAINYNRKLGYQVEKEGDLVEISLNEEDYLSCTRQLKGLLSRNNNRNKQ